MISFVTYIPSFYKSKLLDILSRRIPDFHCVFLAESSQIRTNDFVQLPKTLRTCILHKGPLEERNVATAFWSATKYALGHRARILVLSGWDRLEYWIFAFLTRSSKTVLIVESSIYEDRGSFIKAALKRLFLSRVDTCIVSGEPHRELIRSLNFRGEVLVANGVGYLELQSTSGKFRSRQRIQRLLYLGRLSPEKNLKMLIQAMRSFRDVSLLIAGDGPQRDEIAEMIRNDTNIEMVGAVGRQQLPEVMAICDALILPSTSETWGLVCEEALHFGLPVLVSSKAGSAVYLTRDNQYGISFEPTTEGIQQAIEFLCQPKNYEAVLSNVRKFDLGMKNELYLNAFLKALT